MQMGWHALLEEFADRQYPKDLSYLMISKSTTVSRSHSHGSDYLQAVKILGGSKETAMQSLQLHLTGVARSWLGKLEKETIRSWDELAKQFIGNFKSTYKRPTSWRNSKLAPKSQGRRSALTYNAGV
jgi:hypothetical protein